VLEKTLLPKKNDHHANEDGRVRDVEHRTEKEEVISPDVRYPVRPVEIKNGKEQHVNYLAVKPWSGRTRRMVVQDDAVKDAVNNVSNRTAEDQGHAPQKSGVCLFPGHFPQIVADADHRRYTEACQSKFAKLVVPPDAKGHSRIK